MEDGRINPARFSHITELLAGDPDVTIPSAESNGTRPVIGKPDSPLGTNSELSRSASFRLDLAVIVEPSSADPKTV